MKRMLLNLALIALFLFFHKAFTNPIAELFFNELQLSEGDFALEMRTGFIDSLDGWYMTSQTDTAYFKQGIPITDEYVIITNENMQTDFFIDPGGDKLRLFDSDNDQWDYMEFGYGENYRVIPPKTGQSLSLLEYYDLYQHYYFYLDNSPTFGEANDSLGAMGLLEGYVLDSLENPVINFDIIYDSRELGPPYRVELFEVTTDSLGYFSFQNLARRLALWSKKDGTYDQYLMTVQILPEDTVPIKIYHDRINSLKHDDLSNKFSGYKLHQNYPNPFNNLTVFKYHLPYSDLIDISIYNISGQLIDRIFSGYKNAGLHEISWHADGISSGVYLLRIQTSETVMSKKCIYLK